jgi:hypothetical protein
MAIFARGGHYPWMILALRVIGIVPLPLSDRPLSRQDAGHPWLFDRCREVERDPDGYIDLWARFRYKSTIITFADAIREVLCNPEITIAIFSVVKPIAQAFLAQIKGEFETNELLKWVYPDVLYCNPRTLGPDGRPLRVGLVAALAEPPLVSAVRRRDLDRACSLDDARRAAYAPPSALPGDL